MPVSSDFRVKNGLIVGSTGAGSICGGAGSFTTSLSSASLSGAAGIGLTTGATIALGGDLGGSVALDTLDGTKTLTATIQANSVALGTDTTGNYVGSLTLNSAYETLTGTSLAAAEGNTVTGLGIKASGVTAGSYGSSTAIPVVTVLEDGRVSGVTTSTISTDLTIAADSGSADTVSLGTDTLTFAGTTNEVNTIVTNNQIQIGLPDDVTIAGNLTVNGTHTTLNTSVTSTTTATENNFVIESTDDGATASPDLKLWRNSSSPADNDFIGNIFFTGTTTAPAAAVDYGHIYTQITDVRAGGSAWEGESRMSFKTLTSGVLADRLTINSGSVGIGTTNPNNTLTVAGTLSASGQITGNVTGNITGNADTATALATARNIGGVSFDGTANIVPTTITVADTTSTKAYLGMFESATGDLLPKTDADIFYNAGTCRLTVNGTISAAGVIYADAFNSVTGGSTIDFNDNVDLAGTLTLSSGLAAGTTNSVLIENSGLVEKRAIDSRVFDSPNRLVDNGGSDGTANRLTKFNDAESIIISTISDDGSDIILGTANTTVLVDDDATAGSIQFNNNTSAYHTTTCTVTNAASGVLVSIPATSYRTGKVVISGKGTSACTSHVEATEILMIHDGTNVYTTEYATIRSGDTVGEFHAVVNSGNIELRACNELGGSATATFVTAIQHLTC